MGRQKPPKELVDTVLKYIIVRRSHIGKMMKKAARGTPSSRAKLHAQILAAVWIIELGRQSNLAIKAALRRLFHRYDIRVRNGAERSALVRFFLPGMTPTSVNRRAKMLELADLNKWTADDLRHNVRTRGMRTLERWHTRAVGRAYGAG